MAIYKLPLHICNSIKQYWLIQVSNLIDLILKVRWRSTVKLKCKLESQERITLIVLSVLMLSVNSSGNSYSGGRNSMLRTRIIGTRYGKLQGVILPMDQHKYLKPVEAYLGVPYATPPTGSNRYYKIFDRIK